MSAPTLFDFDWVDDGPVDLAHRHATKTDARGHRTVLWMGNGYRWSYRGINRGCHSIGETTDREAAKAACDNAAAWWARLAELTADGCDDWDALNAHLEVQP